MLDRRLNQSSAMQKVLDKLLLSQDCRLGFYLASGTTQGGLIEEPLLPAADTETHIRLVLLPAALFIDLAL